MAVRVKKAATTDTSVTEPLVPIVKNVSGLISDFESLIAKIANSKHGLEALNREVAENKLIWEKEQKDHQQQVRERDLEEETVRKREKETYDYETQLARRKETDEREAQKAQLATEKKELEELRKITAGFEEDKNKTVKEAVTTIQKDLEEKFTNEKKLREQEIKGEKDLLLMKIGNLEADNSRLNKEIEVLKKSLDEATRQVKEIAVRVIDSARPVENKNFTSEV